MQASGPKGEIKAQGEKLEIRDDFKALGLSGEEIRNDINNTIFNGLSDHANCAKFFELKKFNLVHGKVIVEFDVSASNGKVLFGKEKQ